MQVFLLSDVDAMLLSRSGLIALFENDVTKFCTYACWDTNADKDYIVTLIIVPLLREET